MRQYKWPPWKVITIIVLILAVLIVNVYILTSHAKAEEWVECWILCQPDSFVNARLNPTRKSIEIGRLECGDKIYTDGKSKNGFLHCSVGFEYGEGWVYKGYIVYDKPEKPKNLETNVESNGRVAARKTIDGQRRCWLKDGQTIKVYMISKEWAVTNKGFVKSEFVGKAR